MGNGYYKRGIKVKFDGGISMEKRIKIKLVEKEEEVFIAEDGKEFDNEKDCIDYEKEIKRSNIAGYVASLEIEEAHDMIPIGNDGGCSTCSIYTWYRVNTEKDLKAIEEYYDQVITRVKLPTIIAIEEGDWTDFYYYDIEDIKEMVREFFDTLDIKCVIG